MSFASEVELYHSVTGNCLGLLVRELELACEPGLTGMARLSWAAIEQVCTVIFCVLQCGVAAGWGSVPVRQPDGGGHAGDGAQAQGLPSGIRPEYTCIGATLHSDLTCIHTRSCKIYTKVVPGILCT